MLLPEFPEFKSMDLSCRDIINEILYRYPLEASEYTFANIFAFRFKSAYNFKVSLLRDNLIILKDTEQVSAFTPIGNSQIPNILDEVFNYLKNRTGNPSLERVPESFINAYLKGNKRFVIVEERDHFDYVYNAGELISLKGNRFHDKKNQVNKFRNRYKYEYLTLTPELIEECLKFEDYWCEIRDCEKHAGLKREQCAIIEMLNSFKALNIRGGAIRVEGKIAAITLGEKFLPNTFVIHVEKANSRIAGLYQTINQEFLIHEADDCRFVNREQDLGVDGLRKAKISYNPIGFVKKYKVQEQKKL